MKTTNTVAWIVFIVLAIAIGRYPLLYFVIDREFGLLSTKNEALLIDTLWNIGFYGHILFGGLAMLVGWAQFSKRFREANLKQHRIVGKIYIFSALVSGICGIYIALYATGGIVATIGFAALGCIWIFFTLRAYSAIRHGDVPLHQGMMVYSYAACFAAVTLRLWLPLLTFIFEDFVMAYAIVAWLCWIPNMVFAFFWVRRRGLQLG